MLSTSVSNLLYVGLLSTAVIASPPSSHGYGYGFGRKGADSSSAAKTLYFATNDAQNSLVAIPINSRDGTLSGGVKVSTKGSGGNTALNGTSTPMVPDALGSQNSVLAVGKNIFVVNAGSDTLSMFEAPSKPNEGPRLLATTGKLPGEFATSVAVSSKHQLVCVGFTGAKAGISCLPLTKSGFGKAGPLHSFSLGQSTPPNSLLDFLGGVFFSDDEEHLYATARGKTGFFASIPVSSLLTSSSAGTFSLKGSKQTLFDGFSLPGSDKVFVSDVTVGARILSVNANTQQATVDKTVSVKGQQATCWIVLDEQTGYAYIDDAGRRNLVQIDTKTGSILQELAYGGSAEGGFDLAIAGGYVYILYAGDGKIQGSITVVNTKGKNGGLELVQSFSLKPLGISPNADGIAVSY